MFEETGQSKTLFSENGEEPFNNREARGLTSRPQKKVAVEKLQRGAGCIVIWIQTAAL